MKTAIYARISDDRHDGAGVERQLEDCRALAAQRGWGTVEHVDNDLSASRYARKRRTAYEAMLEAVRAGQLQRIVCWKADRLYRQMLELEDLIKLAEKGQVEIVTVHSGELNLSTGDGMAIARVLVAMDQKASDDASVRQRRQKQQARARGQDGGGPRPFGWQNGHPHPDEAPVLLAAMDEVLAGASLNDLARRWTAGRVRGRKWNSADVGQTLTMPRHAGLVVHQGQIVGEGNWAPLVPRDRWERVCAAIAGRAKNAGMPKRRSMLTGLVRCGVCGEAMSRSTNARGRRAWRCDPGPHRPGCGKVSMIADPLEAIIVEAVFQRVDTLDLAELLTTGGDRPEWAAISERLAAIDREEDEATDSRAGGGITIRALERLTAAWEAERKTLRGQLARQAKQDALSAYAGHTGALRAAWPALTDDQRRAVISEALGRVTIAPATKKGPHFDPSRITFGAGAEAPRGGGLHGRTSCGVVDGLVAARQQGGDLRPADARFGLVFEAVKVEVRQGLGGQGHGVAS